MYGPFGLLAFGQLPDEYDNSVNNPFWLLMQQPDIKLRFLIELHPWDNTKEVEQHWLPAPIGSVAFGQRHVTTRDGAIETIYLADKAFITEPEDSIPNQYFAPVVNNPLQFDVSLLRGEALGSRTSSYGSIQIQNGDQEFDYLADMNWAGRRVVVKAGGPDFKYQDFAIVFDGLCNTIEFDDRVITITIQDKGLRLDQNIIVPLFGGTGGIDGGEDNANKMKPLIYGKVFNVEPVLVDAVNLIYCVHAWSMQAVDAVYDSGVELTFDADYPDITTATPGPGEYATSLATGFIKLGSTPVGRITLNAQGDNVGGYVASVSDICRRVLTTLFGNESYHPSELELGSFNAFKTEVPQDTGFVITTSRSMRSILDELLAPYLAYWAFTRSGKLEIRYIDTEGSPTATITPDYISEEGIFMTNVIHPAWKINIAYAPVWQVQNEDELAGGTTETQRTFVGNEYRMITYEDRNIKRRNARAVERTFYTNFTDKAAADDLLERLIRVYGSEKKIYRGVGYNALHRLYLGDKVLVTYPRYNVNRKMVVLGIAEDAESGTTTLDLWG